MPTPIDRVKRPDLTILEQASATVGRALKAVAGKGTRPRPPLPIVSFESTVYPGCTEEACVPVLERESGLRAGDGFWVGYSPERINPGDREHTIEGVVKVVSGMDEATLDMMAQVYGAAVKAGVYRAADIRTAEAAKVIENIQRDLNISLMNELSMLFHRLGLDSREVFKAAATKWNFLPFQPGLVGGHCIPVDPYYLTHKAQEIGYHPEVILAGRRINDSMGVYVAQQVVKLLIKAGKPVHSARLLVLGAAFKEDTRDLRNTRVGDMVGELSGYGVQVEVHDPVVDQEQLRAMGLRPIGDPFKANGAGGWDGLVLAVPHAAFRERGLEEYVGLLRRGNGRGVLADLKGVLPVAGDGLDGLLYWTL